MHGPNVKMGIAPLHHLLLVTLSKFVLPPAPIQALTLAV